MNLRLPKHEIVLLGAGHTNAHVLRMWRMAPIPDARLTCVSNFSLATYSGMLPGTLAGLYPVERMQIDLVRLCAAAGVRFIRGSVQGLDLTNRELLLDDRPAIPFDALSIGIGSAARTAGIDLDNTVLPIKPMQSFLPRLDDRLLQLSQHIGDRPLRLAVVGAGAGGVEIALCLPARLQKVLAGRAFELAVIDSGPSLASGLPASTAWAVRQVFESRGVKLLLGSEVQSATQGQVRLADGTQHPADLVLWATGAAPPPLLAAFDLPKDAEGFLLRRPTLQSTADASIFVVGDSGSDPKHPTPKAGVYAVRQGPFLWGNLHRHLFGRPLLEYLPQRGFLSLLATGDRRAILSYKGLSFRGRWCWKLKDYIDGRFMDMYQDYTPMPPVEPPPPADRPAIVPCAGCGSKVGGWVLTRALARLDVGPSQNVLLGLDQPGDAAIVQPRGAGPLALSVDFFSSFLDDPYLVGRVAALNSASDLFAIGVRPTAALALATIPPGTERAQEQLLYELLAGGVRELKAMGATLVGGHTIEGPQTAIGYSLLAETGLQPPRSKAGLQPGDALLLTKPLGSGVLLAAHMQARCRAEWLESLLATLLISNRAAAAVADEFELRAATDVTGFGLAGHLLEMLAASNMSADIHLDALPLLPGVEQLIQVGVESTLAPANRHAECSITIAPDHRRLARYAALFDPQTSGGLLLGVPPQHVAAFAQRLADTHGQTATLIGHVTPPHDDAVSLGVV